MDVTYHYTSALQLLPIIASSEIRPAIQHIGPRERPAVWFSSCPTYEPTARKGVMEPTGNRMLTIAEMAERCGLGRIVVPVTCAPFTWAQFVRESGISPADATRLASAGCQMGANPEDWRVSFNPVPYDDWLAVEVWDAGTWQSYTAKHMNLYGPRAHEIS